MKFKTIGVHGESIGGLVASTIAKSRAIDFICCDRTFACIADVARYGFTHAKWLHYVLRIFTNWNFNVANNYMAN